MARKKSRTQRQEQKPKPIALRRAIEDHQKVNRVTAGHASLLLVPDVDEEWDEDESHNASTLTPDSVPDGDFTDNAYLWVYEPSDLDEFSLDEVKLVWHQRHTLCGSREAAAEALALYEAGEGLVELYQGWQGYMGRTEVQELTFTSPGPSESILLELPITPAIEKLFSDSMNPKAGVSVVSEPKEFMEPPALQRRDLLGLTQEQIENAWSRRTVSFASLEAAAGALAILRAQAGINSTEIWRDLMSHVEIRKLADFLPDLDEPISVTIDKVLTPTDNTMTACCVGTSLEEIRSDKRIRRESVVVVRDGQAEFRRQVLANHDHTCAISGCQVVQILEAAHISPYAGVHSDHMANGLCLRVDIHRLFDAFLLSIEPNSWRVVLAEALTDDPDYSALANRVLRMGKTPVAVELLDMHYRSFIRR